MCVGVGGYNISKRFCLVSDFFNGLVFVVHTCLFLWLITAGGLTDWESADYLVLQA